MRSLLNSTSPAFSLLGRSTRGQGPEGLANLRTAIDGDWQPYLAWLESQIRARPQGRPNFKAWNRALGLIRARMLSLTMRRLRPAAAELTMLGLDQVLQRAADLVWDVCSSSPPGQDDITERLRRQHEMAEWAEELRRSNEELEQFAYVASHDLQEPLRTVVNFAELFMERYGEGLDERGQRYLRHVVDGSKRMQALVRALLTYSRVSSQGKELAAVDSQAILRSVCESMRATMQQRNAEVTWAGLPMVMADDVQLAQIFLNLIGNAIKFCDNARPRVIISARREGEFWVFAVQDNGIGIEAEHAGRPFQMFQRLQPRGQYEGSGIGLALTKRIVERHGGRIWFESEAGKGSTFSFSLKALALEGSND